MSLLDTAPRQTNMAFYVVEQTKGVVGYTEANFTGAVRAKFVSTFGENHSDVLLNNVASMLSRDIDAQAQNDIVMESMAAFSFMEQSKRATEALDSNPELFCHVFIKFDLVSEEVFDIEVSIGGSTVDREAITDKKLLDELIHKAFYTVH